ncbi:MAG TPA: protein kinase [Candidatus Aminicenantes bacterium]|nr:protein kinase [Candidatus Aminicenantes bacterium]HPS99256.1 protein kinase [Candidatus Aminicenantes bacterium]
METNMTLKEGERIGHYQIVSLLGRGGMASVYKAHEMSLNRTVALKVLRPELAEDPSFVKRFQREAQAAARLNHPAISTVYAIGQEGELTFFAMEYVQGCTLRQLIRQEGPLSLEKALDILIPAAEALEAAHKAGVVHRDMKPGNILIGENGKVKVVDFGIAQVTESTSHLTREGSFVGTPEYVSPEQCEGKSVDGRSDIYSLGVTFFEMLTGKTPFTADTPAGIINRIVQGNATPLESLNPSLSPEARAVVSRMIHRDREQRYPDASALLSDLHALRSGRLTVPLPLKEGDTVRSRTVVEGGQKRTYPSWATPMIVVVILLVGAVALTAMWKATRRGSQATKKAPAQTALASSQTPGRSSAFTEGSKADPVPGEDQGTLPPSASEVNQAAHGLEVTGGARKGAPSQSDPTVNLPALIVSGDSLHREIGEAYLGKLLKKRGVALGSRDPRWNLSVHLLDRTFLEAYGVKTPQEVLLLSLRRVDPVSGRLMAPPSTALLGVTDLNLEERLQEQISRMEGESLRETLPQQSRPQEAYVDVSGHESLSSYVRALTERELLKAGFTVLEGKGSNAGSLWVRVKADPSGASLLEHYGSQTLRFSLQLSMRIALPGPEPRTVGPEVSRVSFTSLNGEERVPEALGKLLADLRREMKEGGAEE